VIAGTLIALLAQDPLAVRADTAPPRHDALRYEVTLSLPDTGDVIRATVQIRWRLESTEPVRLDLDTAFAVEPATVGRSTSPWRREGARLVFPHQNRAGDTIVTVVTYTGRPVDGLVIRGLGHSRTVFADNWPDRGHRWLASQDHPSDKASVHWRIEAPAGLTVVANGRLVRVERQGARPIWTFDMPEPIPVHTMVVGAARLATIRLDPAMCAVRCVPVSVLSYPRDSAFAADGPFRRASEMIDVFSRLFGEYPYAELRHVQSSTIFGGMENATAIFYGDRAWSSGRLDEGTVAHETAHQWFGDAVSQADWHHLWLSEGFATYGAALWSEHIGGADALHASMRREAESVRGAPVRDRPILDTEETRLMRLLSDNNYAKGAWVLHSLRGLVGDSAFFRGLRAYYNRFRNGNALSRDFVEVMEQVSGHDLDWYFRQALTQPGYPVLRVASRVEGDSAVVEITQVQPAAWGTFRVPGLDVKVDGRAERLDLSGPVTTGTFARRGGSGPPIVEVDPEGWWLLEVQPPPAR
jgi:aminopeptidase N